MPTVHEQKVFPKTLVVEDQPAQFAKTQALLFAEGFRLVSCQSVIEAPIILEQKKFGPLLIWKKLPNRKVSGTT